MLVDRSGEWEAVWQGRDWSTDPAGSGTWSVRERGVPRSSHAGDLDASRCRALLALPSASSWRLEILEDSGRILSPRAWARVPRIDPRTGAATPAPISAPATTSEKMTGSVRLVSLDLPLAALQLDGSLRVRTKLRIRVSWTGSVRTSDGTAWKNLVDNPGGVQPRLAAAGRKFGSALNLAGGHTIAIQVGDTAPFSTQEDGFVRLKGSDIYRVLGTNGGVSWPNVALYGGSSDTVPVRNSGAPPAPGLTLIPFQKLDRNEDGILDRKSVV